jgi:hypothetical protein
MSLKEFATKIEEIKKHYLDIKDVINTNLQSEVIKHLITPFVNLIRDYNPFRSETTYEYPLGKANFHGGFSKCIDIAILDKKTEKAIILIEAKRLRHGNQKNKLSYPHNRLNMLSKYFNFCDPKPIYMVISNGEDYWFFADFKKSYTLDTDPFYKFNLVNYNYKDVKKLYNIVTCLDKKQLKECFKELPYSNKLRKVRREMGLTAKDLAKKLNVSEQRITSIERGEHIPQIDTATNLANALCCTILDLFPPKNYLLKE